jgi:lipopolysaccharide/colanic/teichoic acid biosynthesis glycosyltransferase
MKDFVSDRTGRVLPGSGPAQEFPQQFSKTPSGVALVTGAPYPADRISGAIPRDCSSLFNGGLPEQSRALAQLHPGDQIPGRKTGGNSFEGSYAARGKRALDLALVLMALPVALPIIVLSALLLWVESGLPFYSQDRLGQNGKRFRIFKLRTMVRDADARLQDCLQQNPALRREWDETQKLKKDPRITRIGRILRVTSLDELPQLWNVFTGEMSLVGPRPMMPEQLPLYGEASAYFAVKPGITGLWQVSDRNESSFAARAQADADYLRMMGLQMDLSLIWRTVGVVAKGTGY